MNERMRELLVEAHRQTKGGIYNGHLSEWSEKFAKLIVRECINQAHSVGDLRGANDDMIYGADTAAVKISKHFGVEQ